jgi:dimethylargininase
MLVAFTRPVSACIEKCELTHLVREPINLDLATEQHRQYEHCLAELGCQVYRLPTEPDLPDAVFVEDTAVVLDELAVIMRPGAESRQAEAASTAQGLAPYRKLSYIQPPGTLDGGDVLRLGKDLFVGLSSRSNQAGIEQLRTHTAPYGYHVSAVEVQGCLHLKSAVTQVAENKLLINRDWVESDVFGDAELVDVHPEEPMAANALLLSKMVVYSSSFPRTRARMQAQGIKVTSIDVSELQKAEGGVTCCSLIFTASRKD